MPSRRELSVPPGHRVLELDQPVDDIVPLSVHWTGWRAKRVARNANRGRSAHSYRWEARARDGWGWEVVAMQNVLLPDDNRNGGSPS